MRPGTNRRSGETLPIRNSSEGREAGGTNRQSGHYYKQGTYDIESRLTEMPLLFFKPGAGSSIYLYQ